MGAALLATLHSAVPAMAQEIQERTIRFGHLLNKDHPVSKGVQKFAEIVTARSAGKIKVKEFPSSQLGNELQQQAALQGGTQEMMAPGTSFLTGIVKEFGVLDFPFIVSNEKEADALLDGPLGKRLMDRLPQHGLVGLAYWENGFRNVTNSKRPISRPEDLDGLKIRVMLNPVYIDVFKAVKANPVPLAFGELFTALETRAVDAQENPYAIILSNRFHEVQKYLTKTNHTYNAFAIIVSKKFWDKLSPAEQKILQDAAVEARNYQRQISRAATGQALTELKEKGMVINELSPAEAVRMQQISKPVIEKFEASYDPDTLRLFHSEIDSIRKNRKM
ncbi:ABC transporter substrate-binding protein [Noviherbaspirillum denitrificans]|uniref:ABC transporter substrate-binding protein n=1 Tax=Noviherbaspirillum denitrificans TaxID=1968433 RepID=A0A254T7M1_9BURK|nr:ABC transporter substrate-binding protein [Noviherbaspirillum denitrificans]